MMANRQPSLDPTRWARKVVAMPTEAFASPLIVWFGPNRYTFPVGRDVTIGRDSRADIRVDGVGTSTVFIHDGRAITLGDPQHGPRLVFQLGPPPPPPSRAARRPAIRPAPPPPHAAARGPSRPGWQPAPA